MRRWFLVATYSGAEWVAFTTLLRNGLHAFYPRLVFSKRRGRWPQASYVPQYPGYIFAGVDDSNSIEGIKRVIGVREVCRCGPNLITISNKEIEAFRKQWLKEYRMHLPRRKIYTPLAVGDYITVPSGAFIGMPARIMSIDKSGFIKAQLGNFEVSMHSTAVTQNVLGSAKHAPVIEAK